METVVEKGSGVGAKIDGYRIGGKLGPLKKQLMVFIPVKGV